MLHIVHWIFIVMKSTFLSFKPLYIIDAIVAYYFNLHGEVEATSHGSSQLAKYYGGCKLDRLSQKFIRRRIFIDSFR